jgi:3-hydroxyacyl-[acyl-carrier-protein] dehydratase
MPGVLMLEALVQSAAWLVRVEQDFARSVIVLARARNVRYASFVRPGHVLRCEVEAGEITPDGAKLKGSGRVGETQTVSARLELRCMNLADSGLASADADAAILAQLKDRFLLVGGPEALAAASASAG